MRTALQHNNLYNSRQLVAAVYNDPKTSTHIKKKLKWIDHVIEYAKKNHLNVENSYRYIVFLPHNKALSYTLQAAKPLEFTAITWWFPIIGTVPYRSYINYKEAQLAAQKLQQQKLDTYIAPISAFSSLGWFEDPLYSNLLLQNNALIADTIFHELTHRSIWIKNDVTFNEQLATFIAITLTQQILAFHPQEQTYYQQVLNDQQIFSTWINQLKTALNSMYNDNHRTQQEKLKHKALIIKKFTTILRPKFKVIDYIGNKNWNNARILANNMYLPNLALFTQASSCYSSIGAFLLALKKAPSPKRRWLLLACK